MSKIYILILTMLVIASCTSKSEIEARARHQSQTGDRLNESQKNTESLFKEMDK